MIDAPSLPEFCAEMHRLASVIEARPEFMPACGGPETGGLRVDLKDGAVYLLTYSEKGTAEVVAQNAEADAVMEQVFVEMTLRIATEGPSNSGSPISPTGPDVFATPSVSEIQAMAAQHQESVGAIQLRLMTRLNPDWGRRQAVRNAEREQHIQHFFDRDRP